MADSQLSTLINDRVAIEGKVGRRAAEVLHAWLAKHQRERIAVDEERSNAVTDDRSEMLYGSELLHDDEIDDLDSAIGNLPVTLIRWDRQEPSGYVVTAADLADFLSAPTAAAPHAGMRVEKTVTVTLSEIVNSDLEAFLDLITERAFGSALASDINADIIAHTAQTVDLTVSAELDNDDH
jgi:hypothetical protein